MTVEIPAGWQRQQLKDLINLGRGFAFKSKDYVDDGIVNYRVSNVANDANNLGDTKFLPESFLDEYADYRLNGREIVLVMVGATVGKLGRVPSKICPALLNQNMWTLAPRSDHLDAEYLWNAVHVIVDEHLSKQQGGAYNFFKKPEFLSETMLLPPLPEQKKIAEVLTSVDETISATKAVIDQTKQVKKGLLQTLLTKGISHTKFKETELGQIPESWEVARLDDSGIKVIDGDRGKAYPKASEFTDTGFCLFLSAKNISKSGFRLIENQFIGEERHQLLRKGLLERDDIVLTTRGTVGNIGLYDYSIPYDVVRINSGMVILRNDQSRITTSLLHLILGAPVVKNQIEQLAFGSAQPQLTVKVINGFYLPIPPLNEQPRIAAYLENIVETLEVNEAKLAQLLTLKSGLMSDLLSGSKRVEI